MLDKISLAIIAGGKATRMQGKNKALVSIEGKKIIERQLQMSEHYDEIFIVSHRKEEFIDYGFPVIEDIYKDQGPLGGIHTALLYARNEYVHCIACDMPYIDEQVIKRIKEEQEHYDIYVVEHSTKIEPMCSVYHRSLIGTIEEAIQKEERKLQRFIRTKNCKYISFRESKIFQNYNEEGEL